MIAFPAPRDLPNPNSPSTSGSFGMTAGDDTDTSYSTGPTGGRNPSLRRKPATRRQTYLSPKPGFNYITYLLTIVYDTRILSASLATASPTPAPPVPPPLPPISPPGASPLVSPPPPPSRTRKNSSAAQEPSMPPSEHTPSDSSSPGNNLF
jgi:hypothetical protein